MQLFTRILVLVLILGATSLSHAQHNYGDYNRIGIYGGYTFFDVTTSDLTTQQREGFIAGFTTRGAFYNDFDLVYGINFANSQVGVLGSEVIPSLGINGRQVINTQYIDYTIQSAQLTLLGSYNIIMHHLSIEAGPILNVNGKLKLDSNQFEDFVIEGYDQLRADEIQDISPINLHLAGGVSAGIEQFRVSAQYQYGVTNTLNNLNDNNLENSNFDGHSSLISFAATFYF